MTIRRWLSIPVLLLLAVACGGGTTHTLAARRIPQPAPTFFAGTLTTTTTAPPTTAPPTTPAPVTAPPEGTISQGEYDLISNGMPYSQVVTIVGGPGTLVSQRQKERFDFECAIDRSRCRPPSYVTVQDYRWLADNGGQALITFEDGRVSSKTQSGP
jgi:hypothetical protein